MKRIICIVTSLLLIIPAYSGYAQNKRVRNITGRCEITRNISLSQAEQKALEDAKINAMRKAGVSERLWSVTGLINEDDGSEFNQVLSRMTTLEMNGLITVRDAVYSEETIDGRRYAVATIDADIKIIDTDVDLTFQIEINGIKGIYENGDVMTFTANIYGHDAYLKIFWFDDNGGSIIYPSELDRNMLFKKDVEYTFPVHSGIEYIMEKLDNTRKVETVNFIAIATKRDIPFLEDNITFDSVVKWLYSIPADERAAAREVIAIQ